MTADIGNEMMKMLGLKAAEGGDMEAFERFKANAGAVGMAYILESGLMVESEMTLEQYNTVVGNVEGTVDGSIDDGAVVKFLSRRDNKLFTKKELDKMPFNDLKKHLKALNLPITGKKVDLIKRIQKHQSTKKSTTEKTKKKAKVEPESKPVSKAIFFNEIL